MGIVFDKVSERIFDILKGHGQKLDLYDAHGMKVYDPKGARRFFANPLKMMVSLKEDNENSGIEVYTSRGTSVKDIKGLIDNIRHTATYFGLLFNLRQYGKELEPKMFAWMNEPEQLDEKINWTGTTKTSYQKIGENRLIVKHSAPIQQETIGSRSRNIKAIYLENALGERILWPVKHIAGARAMAHHLAFGGSFNDKIAEHIKESSISFDKLKKFSTYVFNNRNRLNDEAHYLREIVRESLSEIQTRLTGLSRTKNYNQLMETLNNKSDEQEMINEEDQSERISYIKNMLNLSESTDLDESINVIVKQGLDEYRKNKFGYKPGWIQGPDGRPMKDPNYQGTVPATGPMVKKTVNKAPIVSSPESKAWEDKLKSAYIHSSGGKGSGAEDSDFIEQASRMASGQVKLVNGPSNTKPKPASDDKFSKFAKFSWILAEISSRLGPDDIVLANILSRVSQSLENISVGKKPEFTLKHPELEEIIKWALNQFGTQLKEEKIASAQPKIFAEQAILENFLSKFDDKFFFENINFGVEKETGRSTYLDAISDSLSDLETEFNLEEFLSSHGSDFYWGVESSEPEDKSFEEKYILNSLNDFLAKKLSAKGLGDDLFALGDYCEKTAKAIFDKTVKPFLEQNGYSFTDANIAETTNHMNGREFQSFTGWKAACKKINPQVWFEGDKDIAQAFVGPNPYVKDQTKGIGEWDGVKGVVYNNVEEGEVIQGPWGQKPIAPVAKHVVTQPRKPDSADAVDIYYSFQDPRMSGADHDIIMQKTIQKLVQDYGIDPDEAASLLDAGLSLTHNNAEFGLERLRELAGLPGNMNNDLINDVTEPNQNDKEQMIADFENADKNKPESELFGELVSNSKSWSVANQRDHQSTLGFFQSLMKN